MTVSFPGSDVLLGTGSSTAVPGLTTLGVTPGKAPASAGQSQNPYQQAYDSIETWSGSYLISAAENGAPPIPQFTDGSSVSAFAGLTNLLASIKTGLDAGVYGNGIGSTINTYA